jgi:hypothetical protein
MAEKKKEEAKTPRIIIHETLAHEIQNNPKFPHKYWVAEVAKGRGEILQRSGEDPNIVEIVPIDCVIDDLIRFTSRSYQRMPEYRPVDREAAEIVKYWKRRASRVPMPSSFIWPNENIMGFARLPWVLTPGYFPTWQSILKRMGSNYLPFKMWVGSLFDEHSYNQQYLWVHGEGNDGKGCINRFLRRVFGTSYCSKQPPRPDDRFWTYELLGKRLTAFADCNDQKFVASGFFKCLTGGDAIGIEGKNRDSYTTYLNSKFIIFSNNAPDISSQIADKRRIIYCHLKSIENFSFDEGFEDRLWSEGGAFLNECVALYKSHGAKHPIPCDQQQIAEIIEDNEMSFEEIFEWCFEINEQDSGNWLTGTEFSRRLKTQLRTNYDQNSFRKWLGRVKGIKRVSIRHPSGTIDKRYKNLIGRPLKDVAYHR